MFKTRLLSGIVLVAVALLTIISGGYVLFFTLLGISLIGMQELYKVMKAREDHFNALEIAGYLGAVIYYVLMSLDFEKYGMMGVIISFMMFMFVYVFTYPKFKAEQVMPVQAHHAQPGLRDRLPRTADLQSHQQGQESHLGLRWSRC